MTRVMRREVLTLGVECGKLARGQEEMEEGKQEGWRLDN